MSQQSQPKRRRQYDGYPPPTPNEAEVRFVEACGLRRSELVNLRVRDIRTDEEGRVWIHVARQEGRKEREVPVLAGHEQVILARVQDARLFSDFPKAVDVQGARREYASSLYYHLLGASWDLPLHRKYYEGAARTVMQALGHYDLEVVCRYYLRLQGDPADQMMTNDTSAEPADQESTQAE